MLSGQLPGVTATSVHLIILASSVPASHAGPPVALRLRAGQPFASSVCPQGTAGHSWQVAQPGFKAALFRLNWTIQPTTDGILRSLAFPEVTPPHYGCLSRCLLFREGLPRSTLHPSKQSREFTRDAVWKKNRPTRFEALNKTDFEFPFQTVTCARIQVRGDYKVTVERGWLFHLTCHTRICKSERVWISHCIFPDGGSAIVCVAYSHSSTGPQRAQTGGSQICDTILGNACFIHEHKGTHAQLVASRSSADIEAG